LTLRQQSGKLVAHKENNYERFTMKLVRPAVAALGLAVALSMGACGSSSNDNNNSGKVVECDAGDQVERDDDCGYYDDNGNWVWYPWVVMGQTSYSQPGFQKVEQEDSDHGHKKKSKKKFPSFKKSPKPASAPKAVQPKPVNVAPAKPVTVNKPAKRNPFSFGRKR
jgi:hypothetical protein